MSDPNYAPDRRPISSRNHPASIRAARWLADKGVSPNAISVAGMVAGIAAGTAFALTTLEPYGWLLFFVAALGMQLRLLANMFDGMVAIQTSQASPVGELYNEVPDRVSDTAICIGAGYAAGGCPELGFLAAIAALFTAYVRAEGKVAGAPQDYCGPMAKPQRMALLTLAAVIAPFVPATWLPVDGPIAGFGVIAMALLIVALGAAFTTLRRLLRAASALRHAGRP